MIRASRRPACHSGHRGLPAAHPPRYATVSTPAVVLSLWAGAVLGGAGGVVLAIPVAGFLSVSLRHWREYRDIERLVRTSARKVVGEQPDRSEHERHEEAGREQ